MRALLIASSILGFALSIMHIIAMVHMFGALIAITFYVVALAPGATCLYLNHRDLVRATKRQERRASLHIVR